MAILIGGCGRRAAATPVARGARGAMAHSTTTRSTARIAEWSPLCGFHFREIIISFLIEMDLALSLCDSGGHFEILLKYQFQCFSKL